jgi:hypothetical protein
MDQGSTFPLLEYNIERRIIFVEVAKWLVDASWLRVSLVVFVKVEKLKNNCRFTGSVWK